MISYVYAYDFDLVMYPKKKIIYDKRVLCEYMLQIIETYDLKNFSVWFNRLIMAITNNNGTHKYPLGIRKTRIRKI